MQTVGFKAMADGSREDYELLGRLEEQRNRTLPDRLLRALEQLKDSFAGYQVSRYDHSLQSATRAYRAGESEEYVAAALLHDIGDELAPHTHGQMVAAILEPFVSEEICWIIRHHGLFQSYYYAHHTGGDRHARDRYAGHPSYEACARFCERYDQNCFDPEYDSLPVEVFAPILRRVFSEPRYLDRY